MTKRLLITGATGKVGQTFIKRFLSEDKWNGWVVRALCHNRVPEPHDRIEVVKGSISERGVVDEAMADVTHVLHMATCKEIPEDVMDVTVKGMFWLLEASRESPTFEQFILTGGDAGVGHFVYPHPVPVTEMQGHSAYPGCYALSKVLEEVMLEQYYIQYDLNGCCLRAPWIMEKDDFKYSLSFGDDQFGGPSHRELVGDAAAKAYAEAGTVPVLQDENGDPIQRNFVHVDDLVEAMLCALDNPKATQELFNICMDEPVNYQEVADHLKATQGLDSVPVETPFNSTWLDNTKAKFLLEWRPLVDTKTLIDRAWSYQRSADDPRKIWYPG